MDAELDHEDLLEDHLEDIPPKTLRKMLRSLMSKMGRKPGDKPANEDGDEKEREDLADLHEEKKGRVPKQPVEKDDLPFDLDGGEAEDESQEDVSTGDDESPEPPKKKRSK